MSNLKKFEEYVIAPGETLLELLETNFSKVLFNLYLVNILIRLS